MKTHSPMVIHYIHDMDRAYDFYHKTLGLEPETRSAGWSTFRCGELTVALHILGGDDGEAVIPHAGLNLQVDDLDAAVEELKAGGGTVQIIREAGGGVPVRLAEVTDTEGNGFQLRQWVGFPSS